VAQLGQRLNVDLVLLVGVSDLGDTILAFQLVSSRTGDVVGRVADSRPKHDEPDDLALDGYLKRLLPKEDFLRWGTLRIDANVSGAAVEINGKQSGVTPLEPVRLPAPLRIDLRVSKSGYEDFSARLVIQPDYESEVRPVLVQRGGEGAWYTKAWVWGIAAAVVAGSVATYLIVSQGPATSVPVTGHFP
jgi:hypothetical protein